MEWNVATNKQRQTHHTRDWLQICCAEAGPRAPNLLPSGCGPFPIGRVAVINTPGVSSNSDWMIIASGVTACHPRGVDNRLIGKGPHPLGNRFGARGTSSLRPASAPSSRVVRLPLFVYGNISFHLHCIFAFGLLPFVFLF